VKLVIIEAPAKRETLKKYLGDGYEVFATKGHIRDLPANSFAIDMKNNYDPKYEIMPDKKDLIRELKSKANKAEQIYLATDPDREGEAIAWHIANILEIPFDRKCRIEYHEISKNAVQKAIEEPRSIDLKLVDAQQARRVLDRIVGYKLSPILCKKIKPRLSAGRVQSVALKLVVDREKEIENFIPEEYWTANAFFEKNSIKFKATLTTKKGRKFVPKNKDEINVLNDEIKEKDYVVSQIKKTNTKSHAPAPFTTSSMQQDAVNKLGMSSKKITSCAQELYEGVNVAGEGKIALITYIRTDSTRVSSEAQNACRAFIKSVYGDKFVPEKPNIYTTKQNAQDAHEAIRPINMNIKPEDVKSSLTPDNYKLYKLIYERFLASQMSDALYSNVTATIDIADYGFKAVGKTQDFAGYTAVYREFEGDETKEISKLPQLNEGEVLKPKELKTEQKFTKPPARYTEASIIDAMEKKGIGRPATYAATLAVLTSRAYCTKEGKSLVPTELGRNVTQYLDQFFSSVINVKFTAFMEKRLDDIAQAGEDWKGVVDSFWSGFSKLLTNSGASNVTMKDPPQETDIVCEKCGGKMLIREGKFGKFLGCANFPKCKNIMSLQKEEQPKLIGKCPECGKPMTERKSKRGKVYYSCSSYPDCKYMSWYPTTGEKCKICNEPMIVRNNITICSNNECATNKKEG